MKILTEHLKKHLDLSLQMLVDVIRVCPDHLWSVKVSGFVFWQQIYHVLSGLLFWTRKEGGEFTEPFQDRKLFPELDGEPVSSISKSEMKALANRAKMQIEDFFDRTVDSWIKQNNVIYPKLLNIDVIEMQIRHIQYHVGHCDAALRERDFDPSQWYDYMGEDD